MGAKARSSQRLLLLLSLAVTSGRAVMRSQHEPPLIKH